MKLIKREEKEVIQYLYGKYLTGELDLEAFKLQISAVKIVDEDGNWNLATHVYEGLSRIEDIKKCRDLILEDIENSSICISSEKVCEIVGIINSRFGDLK